VKTEPLEVVLGPWPEENAAPTEQEAGPDPKPIEVTHKEQECVGADSRLENASWGPVNTGEQPPTVVSGLSVQSSEHPN